MTLIAGVSDKGLEGMMIVEKGCKKYTFLYFMKKIIERQIEIGEDLKKVVFVLDNCPIHHSIVLQNELLNKVYVLYLSPYSPFLNPIEWFWSNLKQKLFKEQHPVLSDLMESTVIVAFSFSLKYFNNNYYKTMDFHMACMNLNKNIYQLR